jgi:hypothetical protein
MTTRLLFVNHKKEEATPCSGFVTERDEPSNSGWHDDRCLRSDCTSSSTELSRFFFLIFSEVSSSVPRSRCFPTMINRGESADPTSQRDARGSDASELHDVLRVDAPGGGVRIAIENRHRHKAGPGWPCRRRTALLLIITEFKLMTAASTLCRNDAVVRPVKENPLPSPGIIWDPCLRNTDEHVPSLYCLETRPRGEPPSLFSVSSDRCSAIAIPRRPPAGPKHG